MLLSAWRNIGLIAVFLVGASWAYADTVQQQLQTLQNQIDALNQHIQAKVLVGQAPIVTTDAKLPIGDLSKTHMPYIILSHKYDYTAPLVLGGYVEADAQTWNGSFKSRDDDSYPQNGNTLALTKAHLISMANLNSDTFALVELRNNLPDNNMVVEGGFLTFGNFAKSPWYFTVGNTYLPFGNFNGDGPLDNSLLTNAFRVSNTNQATLGLNLDNFDTNIAVFSNNSYANNGIHDFVLNTEWFKKLNSISSLKLSVGYLNDIRGTSSGVGEAYEGNVPSSNATLTGDTNGAVDGSLTYEIDHLSVFGEYISTTQSALDDHRSTGNLSAWLLGSEYRFHILQYWTHFQLSYSQTQNMQDVNLPLAGNYALNLKTKGIKSEWLTSIEPEVWHNVYVGPEFDFNRMYAGTSTWVLSMDFTAYF